MIILTINVDYITQVLQYYDQIKVYRCNTEDGSYAEVTSPTTRIDLIPETTVYFYEDSSGDGTKWYKTSYYHSSGSPESVLSSATQGETQPSKLGYSFNNYSPMEGEWGKVITPDDVRYTLLWGIDLVAADTPKSEVLDSQLDFCIENALSEFESNFNIDIRKRVYKVEPAETLNRSEEWRNGVDYTDEEDWYDFNAEAWTNYGFLQLKHKPILSIELAELYSPWGLRVLDILDWVRIQKKSGQLSFFPKGSTVSGTG